MQDFSRTYTLECKTNIFHLHARYSKIIEESFSSVINFHFRDSSRFALRVLALHHLVDAISVVNCIWFQVRAPTLCLSNTTQLAKQKINLHYF